MLNYPPLLKALAADFKGWRGLLKDRKQDTLLPFHFCDLLAMLHSTCLTHGPLPMAYLQWPPSALRQELLVLECPIR